MPTRPSASPTRPTAALVLAVLLAVASIAALALTLALHTPPLVAADWYIGIADDPAPRFVDRTDPEGVIPIVLLQVATALVCALACVNLVLVLRRPAPVLRRPASARSDAQETQDEP